MGLLETALSHLGVPAVLRALVRGTNVTGAGGSTSGGGVVLGGLGGSAACLMTSAGTVGGLLNHVDLAGEDLTLVGRPTVIHALILLASVVGCEREMLLCLTLGCSRSTDDIRRVLLMAVVLGGLHVLVRGLLDVVG